VPSQHDKAKWWRPRFSVRTLAVAITLVCCYFGAWDATKRWGIPAGGDPTTDAMVIFGREPTNTRRIDTVTSPLPFVIRCDEYEPPTYCPTRYYVWVFGLMVKLPFETTWFAGGLP